MNSDNWVSDRLVSQAAAARPISRWLHSTATSANSTMNIYMRHKTWKISLQGGVNDKISTPCSGLHDGRRCWPRPDSHQSRILGLHQITEVPRHRITFAPLHRNSHLLPWRKWITAPDQQRRVRRHPRCSDFESASSESIHENFLVLRWAQWPNDRNPNLFHDIDPRSHAQWARPVSFNHESMCEIEGQLQIEVDVKRLVNLYYSNAPQRRPRKYDNKRKEET